MPWELQNVSPIIRVPGVDKSEILKALEVGAHGIQVPNIDHPDQLKEVISYVKYPPIGTRGFSPFTRAGQYSAANGKALIDKANSNVLTNIHIEGRAGVDAIDKMLDNENVDVYFLGLYDLSVAYGQPGDVSNPSLIKIFESLVGKINKAGKICGSISNSDEQLKMFCDIGVRYITHSVDCHMIRTVYEKALSKIGSKGCGG